MSESPDNILKEGLLQSIVVTTMTEIGTFNAHLPRVEQNIAGLKLGAVVEHLGELQVYFGGNSVERLTEWDHVTLRDGVVDVTMYTIDGNKEVDYALVRIATPRSKATPLDRARLLRGLTRFPITDYVERTPVQNFICRRGFMDIPVSGRARWLAIDPEGNFSTGVYDDRDTDSQNNVAMFGEGWTFAWVVEGSKEFVFGELCSPRFIDSNESVPLGEDGIVELNTPEDRFKLDPDFQLLFEYYMSGEQFNRKSTDDRTVAAYEKAS